MYIVIGCLAERNSNTTLCHTGQRVHLCSGEYVSLVRLLVCLSLLNIQPCQLLDTVIQEAIDVMSNGGIFKHTEITAVC